MGVVDTAGTVEKLRETAAQAAAAGLQLQRGAAGLLLAGLATSPQQPHVLLRLAEAATQLPDKEALISAGLQADNTLVNGWAALGGVYCMAGRMDAAEECYVAARKIDVLSSELWEGEWQLCLVLRLPRQLPLSWRKSNQSMLCGGRSVALLPADAHWTRRCRRTQLTASS